MTEKKKEITPSPVSLIRSIPKDTGEQSIPSKHLYSWRKFIFKKLRKQASKAKPKGGERNDKVKNCNLVSIRSSNYNCDNDTICLV